MKLCKELYFMGYFFQYFQYLNIQATHLELLFHMNHDHIISHEPRPKQSFVLLFFNLRFKVVVGIL